MTKRKEKEEPGKVYQVRNELHVGEQMNPPMVYWQNIQVCLQQLYGWLGSTTLHYYTTLHYLEVRQAMVSVHTLHLKTTVICSFTRQTDRCTPQRMASKVVLNTKTALSRLCSSFPCTVVRKSCQNGLQPKYSYVYCGLLNYIHVQLGNLPTLN